MILPAVLFTSTTTMTLRPRTTTRAIITVLQCSEQQCIHTVTYNNIGTTTYICINKTMLFWLFHDEVSQVFNDILLLPANEV